MGWETWAGIGTLIVFAYACDEEVTHPAWLEELPKAVRVAVNALALALIFPLILVATWLVHAGYQLLIFAVLVGSVAWLLFQLARDGWSYFRPRTDKPDDPDLPSSG